jgi:hypothetical protein
MSFELPVVLTGELQRPAAPPRARAGAQQAAAAFRVDLAALTGAVAVGSPQAALKPSGGGARAEEAELTLSMGRSVARMMYASQVLIVLVLCVLVFTLLFVSYRLNYNVNYYYEAAAPYLREISNHSMSVMRHADASSHALESVMEQTRSASASSLPALARSINETSEMVSRFGRVVESPTIKLSLA